MNLPPLFEHHYIKIKLSPTLGVATYRGDTENTRFARVAGSRAKNFAMPDTCEDREDSDQSHIYRMLSVLYINFRLLEIPNISSYI